MRVVVDDRKRRLSPRSHSRLRLLLNGKHLPEGTYYPLWTNKYPQHPAAFEVVSRTIPSPPTDSRFSSPPFSDPHYERSKISPPLPTLKRRCRSRIFRAQRTTMANQTVSASVSPGSTTNALGTCYCCEMRESESGQDGDEG
jgi:hypothetical protein